MSGRGRDPTLDVMRCLGITLVVLGHALIFARSAAPLVKLVYSFHMPLLFSISGYVTALTLREGGGVMQKIGHSAKRLLVPYAVWGLGVIPAVNTMITGNPVHEFWASWVSALVDNSSLWFLPCCFILIVLCCAAEGLRRRLPSGSWGGPLSLAAVSAALVAARFLLPGVDYFRSATNYLFSFLVGVAAFDFREPLGRILGRRSVRMALWAAFLLSLTAYMADSTGLARQYCKPLVGLTALYPVAVVSSALCRHVRLAAVLEHVGRSTLAIYCFDFFLTPLAIRPLQALSEAGIIPQAALLAIVLFYVPLAMGTMCLLRAFWREVL